MEKKSGYNDLLQICQHQAILRGSPGVGHITKHDLGSLLRNKEFVEILFSLFSNGETLTRKAFLSRIRQNLGSLYFHSIDEDDKIAFIDLVDSAAHNSVAKNKSELDAESFGLILSARGISGRMWRVIVKTDYEGVVTPEELANSMQALAKRRNSQDRLKSKDTIEKLKLAFEKNLKGRQDHLSLEDFKRIMPRNNVFFIQRLFQMFDLNGDGRISMSEFLDAMTRFSHQDAGDKIVFLFKLYDQDGDGGLSESEIETVMRASLEQSGLSLPDSDVMALTGALYDEAIGETSNGAVGHGDEISIEQLKRVFQKHPGLIDNLTDSLTQWLVPKDEEENKANKKNPPSQFIAWLETKTNVESLSWKRLRNQWQLALFLMIILLANIALLVTRALEFVGMRNLNGRQNYFYLLSRACGRALLLQSVLIFVLVLRYSITKLRDLGLSRILPLDHNIYIHKLVGASIFCYSWIHAIMHVCNFSINVTPDPLTFVEMNGPYWPLDDMPDRDPERLEDLFAVRLGYQPPYRCKVVSCQQEYNFCQVCPNCTEHGQDCPYTAVDWLFKPDPGLFGLIGGWANPTGMALLAVVTVMSVSSMPFVRRGGFFQVFFLTHLLYWAYVMLLILHAPVFWMCIFMPLVVFTIEKTYRLGSTLVGQGRTYIVEGVPMASRVTKLVIRRPPNFHYSPGDWAFVRIPSVATFEWHPFTISSAPEVDQYITMHVRSAGQWTGRLYKYYEDKRRKDLRENFANKRRRGGGHVNVALEGEEEEAGSFSMRSYGSYSSWQKPEEKLLRIDLDGPFGAPASSMFRASHAVLVATGIGVTPFSSILQSIMFRHLRSRQKCPNCGHDYRSNKGESDSTSLTLKKVDFFWINRDQKAFEWFLALLDEMEEQQAKDESMSSLIQFHLYMTNALRADDVRAVGLQVALDLVHKRQHKDLLTKLRVRTNPGRPNWDECLNRISREGHGEVTVFYCGNPQLARVLRRKCGEYGFGFRKEVF